MKSILGSIIIHILSSVAIAASGSMDATITTSNALSIYSANSAGSSTYTLSNSSGTVLSRVVGSEALSSINDSKSENLSDMMPNSLRGEYSKMSLSRGKGNKGNLLMQGLRYNEAGALKQNYNIEIELIKGTWADFDKGLNVTAMLSKKGTIQSKAELTRIGKESAALIAKGFSEMGAKITSSKLTVTSSSNDIMTLNKSEIIIPQSKMTVNVKLQVKL
jgi:hypothetical protein